jgi:putative oligomerization/nucleic acid binding protein
MRFSRGIRPETSRNSSLTFAFHGLSLRWFTFKSTNSIASFTSNSHNNLPRIDLVHLFREAAALPERLAKASNMALTRQLTTGGDQAIHDLAQRYGVSVDAVRTLLFAVSAGGGTLAQFNHPELGGNGQWMSGGMTMVGDMFNYGLKATVSALCSELSSLLSSQQVFVPLPARRAGGGFIAPGNAWWPAELGRPSSSGGQNDARYAYFSQSRRLAILHNGKITLYDTLDHQIGGVQQQQGGYAGSLTFSSQYGTFSVDTLPLVSSGSDRAIVAPSYEAPEPPPPPIATPRQGSVGALQSHDEILKALERIGDLHQKGILSDDEFKSKKAELLSRL